VNSVTGEEEKLEAILPLIAKYNVPVVAISNDETGISEDPDVRFAVAKKIVERAADFGIKPHDIVVDPLVMPIGAMGTAGQQVFAWCGVYVSESEHHLRRFQRLSACRTAEHDRLFPRHGRQPWHDVRHHEPAA
jgi:cobalamin-dependent methionine synthase I